MISASNIVHNLINHIKLTVYKLWAFTCLYILGIIYCAIEFNRRYELFYKVRHLDVEKDLPDDLSSTVVLITGGTRGIGLEVVKVLINKGSQVIIASSTKPGRAIEELRRKLMSECSCLNPKQLQIWNLNLESMESVLNLVRRIKEERIPINLLINNAGIMFAPYKRTEDGFESQFSVNYLGHFLLTWSLVPILIDSSKSVGRPSRIVNVSSSTHYSRNLEFDNLQGEQLYSPHHAYAQSKLAQIMFTYRLEEYLKTEIKTNYINVNCVHPGVALTELYEHVLWVRLFPWLARILFRSAKGGAETIIYAAISDEMEGVGGKYLEDCKICKSSPFSNDQYNKEKLWNITWTLMKPWIDKLGLK